MTHPPGQAPIGVRRRAARPIVVATANAATGLAWEAGRHAPIDYTIQTSSGGAHHITVVLVVATAIFGPRGWAIYGTLARYTIRASRASFHVARTVLPISMAPVILLCASTDTRLALIALDCIAAAILIPGSSENRQSGREGLSIVDFGPLRSDIAGPHRKTVSRRR